MYQYDKYQLLNNNWKEPGKVAETSEIKFILL